MLYEAVQRTARLLSDPRWWEPLVHATCSRCFGRIAPTERRVIDGSGETVTVLHVACVLRRTAARPISGRAGGPVSCTPPPRFPPRTPRPGGGDRRRSLPQHRRWSIR